jgi:hypothetical protein
LWEKKGLAKRYMFSQEELKVVKKEERYSQKIEV